MNGTITAAYITTQGTYSVQPTYPNTPTNITGSGSGASITITSSSDSWRTFQVRDGFVGWRPKNPQFITSSSAPGTPINGTAVLGNFSMFSTQILGNSIWTLPVVGDGSGFSISNTSNPNPQPATDASTGIILPLNADVIVSGYDAGGYPVNFGQVLLANDAITNPEDQCPPIMSFWIEVIDDPVKGFYANLMARMCGGTAGDLTPGPMCPIGKNIIPIGCVFAGLTGGGSNWTPTGFNQYFQIQIGNVYNQFETNGGGRPSYYRGAWTADALTGQIFYNGDWIIDDTATFNYDVGVDDVNSNTVTINAYPTWMYNNSTAEYGIETSEPTFVSHPNWSPIGWAPVVPEPLNP
jgi:hypothetical protein